MVEMAGFRWKTRSESAFSWVFMLFRMLFRMLFNGLKVSHALARQSNNVEEWRLAIRQRDNQVQSELEMIGSSLEELKGVCRKAKPMRNG